MNFSRPKIIFSLIGLLLLLASCQQKIEQRARISPETCSSYVDPDKKNWCLGKCDEVKNTEYQKICRKNAANRRD